MIQAFTELAIDTKNRGFKDRYYVMYNKASAALKKKKNMEVKYQLGPWGKQMAKNTERDIKTIKNYFISGMCSVIPEFHLQLLDRMIQQSTISLNLLSQSRLHPQLYAYAHLNCDFYYNKIPLSSQGTKVVVHERPGERASWAPHGEPVWHIGPSMEHYWWHKAYINDTRSERISDTLELFPKKFTTPNISYTDASINAAHDLIH